MVVVLRDPEGDLVCMDQDMFDMNFEEADPDETLEIYPGFGHRG